MIEPIHGPFISLQLLPYHYSMKTLSLRGNISKNNTVIVMDIEIFMYLVYSVVINRLC